MTNTAKVGGLVDARPLPERLRSFAIQHGSETLWAKQNAALLNEAAAALSAHGEDLRPSVERQPVVDARVADGSMTVQEGIEAVCDLFPGADRQALVVLARALTRSVDDPTARMVKDLAANLASDMSGATHEC